jgi:hypothetical protein
VTVAFASRQLPGSGRKQHDDLEFFDTIFKSSKTKGMVVFRLKSFAVKRL